MNITRFPSFSKYRLFQATFPRKAGSVFLQNSLLTYSGDLERNLEQISGISKSHFITSEQVHGTGVAVLKKDDDISDEVIPKADGLVTDKKGVLLIVRHADCVPIFIYDPIRHAAGLIHSGWKGTAGKIGLEALKKMMVEFGTNPKNVLIGLGPCAHSCCYAIEEGWPHEVLVAMGEWKPFLRKKKEGWLVDLPGFIKKMYSNFGVNPKNIAVSNICTICNQEYHSWTRQKKGREEKGLGVSVMALL